MRVFARVAQHASFAAAARELHKSTAAVSKHVGALESRIGARLFDRTTRRVGLTEAGRVYLERCLECLQAADDADASVSALAGAPRGLLRVTAPVDFGDVLAPVLADVMDANPHLVIDLRLSNRVVDLVEEGVDVGVRVTTGLDNSYVARPFARTRLAVFGAPEYFRRYGRPRRPEELARHRSAVFVEPRPMSHLVFTRGKRKVDVELGAVMTSNHGGALLGAVRSGVALALVPSFLAHEDVVACRIEPILREWSLPEPRVFAVYPHRRFLSPKVRTLVEALRARFGDGSRSMVGRRSLILGETNRRLA
jgi:DNA-binding transcriptional LysR family regulator